MSYLKPSKTHPKISVNVIPFIGLAAAKSIQSCPTLYDPIDGSPLGSSVPGILQARILEWVAIPFSGDLPDPGIEPMSPALAEGFFTT